MTRPENNAGQLDALPDQLVSRNVMVGHGQWERLRRLAFEQRRSMSEIVREAIDAHLHDLPPAA